MSAILHLLSAVERSASLNSRMRGCVRNHWLDSRD
jgi:hypothetical protein